MSDDTSRADPKPPPVDRLALMWRRINDYKIVQWSIAYVALAYGIQHGMTLTSEAFEWPPEVLRISMVLLALGLPLVITLAWYHGERASRHFSRAEVTIVASLLVTSALLFYVFVRPAEQPAGVAAARAAASTPAGAISLAVLPFANLSGDANQEFFSDGMTEEITAALAKVSDLRVVARASAFQFKGEKKDMRAVGQALSARYLIDGSVRKAGTRVRISAQLIEAGNGLQVWTENYDRELTDIFAMQEDIARAIAASLRVPLGLKQDAQLVSSRAIDPESYQQYLRARALVRGRAGLSDAAASLEQVVAHDPVFAPAWAQLALAYALLPINTRGTAVLAMSSPAAKEIRRVSGEALSKAELNAQRALQLDASLADAYVSIARASDARGKLQQAEEAYSKALAIDPNNPEALSLYSNMLAGVGRLKEALTLKQRALALEPFVPVYQANTAYLLWLNGETETAIAKLKSMGLAGNALRLPTIYAAAGRFNEAADTLSSLPAGIYPAADVKQALSLLRTAPRPHPSAQNLPSMGVLDIIFVYVGAPERVLDFYEQSVELGYAPPFFTSFLWHASYGIVRKTERFKALVRSMGLVEYWRAKGWPAQCHPTTADDFACE